jgi:hypothetical protein
MNRSLMTTDSGNKHLDLLYEENAKVIALFLDWRDKVMNRSFAVTGAVFVAAGWLYQQPDGRIWLPIPFLLGALFSAISLLLDHRNGRILAECFRIGGEIEEEWTGEPKIYKFIGQTRSDPITYNRVLRISYGVLTLLHLLLSLVTKAIA